MGWLIGAAVVAFVALVAVLYVRSARRERANGHQPRGIFAVRRDARESRRDIRAWRDQGGWAATRPTPRSPGDRGPGDRS
jgi:hypothetical protein